MNSQDNSDDGGASSKISTYEGEVTSPDISGNMNINIGEDGVVFDALFDSVAVPYADVWEVKYEDYNVYVKAADRGTGDKTYVVSKMGQQIEWFYRELVNAYNAKILSAMHIDTNPLLKSRGSFSYGKGEFSGDNTDVAIYADSLVILPSDKSARRIPLAFITGMKKEDYTLTITDVSNESYTLSRFGYDLDPIEKMLRDNILKLRDHNKELIEKITGSLSFSDMAQAQKIFYEGLAVRLDKLPASLVSAIKKLAKKSGRAEEFALLDGMGVSESVAMGVMECPEEGKDDEDISGLAGALTGALTGASDGSGENSEEETEENPWIIYYITESSNRQFAIVEFSFPDEEAATYIFRTGGQYDAFLTLFNYGFEATKLDRDIISLPKEKLSDDMKILTDRTPAIQILRQLFVGKAIHRSKDSWKKSVLDYTSA